MKLKLQRKDFAYLAIIAVLGWYSAMSINQSIHIYLALGVLPDPFTSPLFYPRHAILFTNIVAACLISGAVILFYKTIYQRFKTSSEENSVQ